MNVMNLFDYLSQGRGRQAALAKAIGVNPPDIIRWRKGKRPIPTKYGAAIEQATDGQVTRKELFPDEWEQIWPELAVRRRKTDKPPSVPAPP